MEDAAGVGVVHRLGRLGHEPRGGPGVVAGSEPERRQAAAVDQLHAEVVLALVLADLVDRDDAGVVEQGDGLGLVAEPPQFGVASQRTRP